MTDPKVNDLVRLIDPPEGWEEANGRIFRVTQALGLHLFVEEVNGTDEALFKRERFELVATSVSEEWLTEDSVQIKVESSGPSVVHGISDAADQSFLANAKHDWSKFYNPSNIPGAPVVEVDLSSKPTNPKDAIGSSKLPLHLWPSTATVLGCLALLEGALKYGRSNWRSAGVKASIYVDALDRHMKAWMEGEDCAPDSKIPHLGHALACIAILIDAEATGKLVDDRNFNGAGYHKLVEEMTSHVERLKAKHADKSPHHFTIADAVEGTSEPL